MENKSRRTVHRTVVRTRRPTRSSYSHTIRIPVHASSMAALALLSLTAVTLARDTEAPCCSDHSLALVS